MICPVFSVNDICPIHGRRHIGHTLAIALDPSPEAERYRIAWKGVAIPLASATGKPVPYTAPQMIAEYTATLAKHMAGGRVMVPDEVHQERRTLCNGCQHRNIELDACRICKCKLSPSVIEATILGDKLRWAVSKCPVGKWDEHQEKPALQSRYSWQTRHLLFHLWPKKTSQGTWQRNLDQIKQRWSLFDGKRVIAVATSQDSHPLEAVQDYMRGYDCEWIHVENDASLREVKTFLPLFERVEGLPGYTFYAQGKGVTKPINPGVSIHAWTSAMYETLLDYWPLVEDHLKRFPVVGSFKKAVDGAFGGSSSTWHYSGSFCWFNNEQLWRRNWRAIEHVWFGIESYPSMIFGREEAGCIFYCQTRQFNLYNLSFWNKVENELKQWRADHARYRSIP